jgi:hypothetical protein
MRSMKWVGIAAAILLIVSCFFPWVVITTKNITVTGVDATGTNFGRPGYFNLLFTAFFLLFTVIPVIWAKRANVVVAGFNLAWAIRNYLVVSACRGGDCPEKQLALYLMVVASFFMLLSSLFPYTNVKKRN